MTDVKKRNTPPINNMMKIKSPLLRSTRSGKAGKILLVLNINLALEDVFLRYKKEIQSKNIMTHIN
ncbi:MULTISPECIES: hypothetical protein [Methanosarcina]|uniref:hypothetical protein n=1 Tax=Methanosarcina TaxID=2207 RepID=UPI000AD1DBC2|nr:MULTISPECIES: hypothetical protein [Methanosarcina]